MLQSGPVSCHLFVIFILTKYSSQDYDTFLQLDEALFFIWVCLLVIFDKDLADFTSIFW